MSSELPLFLLGGPRQVAVPRGGPSSRRSPTCQRRASFPAPPLPLSPHCLLKRKQQQPRPGLRALLQEGGSSSVSFQAASSGPCWATLPAAVTPRCLGFPSRRTARRLHASGPSTARRAFSGQKAVFNPTSTSFVKSHSGLSSQSLFRVSQVVILSLPFNFQFAGKCIFRWTISFGRLKSKRPPPPPRSSGIA